MRTQEEIKKRVDGVDGNDFFGFEFQFLVVYLDFEHAKEFLKEGTTNEHWDKHRGIPEKESVRKEAVDYMPFAWEKANGCRGISAARSIAHYKAWMWLLGESEEWCESLDDYEHYGKDKLVEICEKLDLDPTQWDDGVRTNHE